MKSSPLVSVIIPVYNTPKEYLTECFESVQNQDYKNIEVIVVDDGSDEATAKRVDDFVSQAEKTPDEHKWQAIHQKNKGLSGARNSGYRHATGKYIQFLDSDDYFDSRLISSAVTRAEGANSEIVVENFIVRDYDAGTEQTVLHANSCPTENETFRLSDLDGRRFETIPYNVWSKLFRKDFLDDNGLSHDEKLLRAEDILFSYTALVLAKRISMLSEAYITYRENLPGSNSKTNDRFPSASVDAWRELHRTLEGEKLFKLYRKDFEESMLGSIHWHLIKLHTAEGKRELAIAAQGFMAEIDNSTINDYSVDIAIASVNPELLQLIEKKNNQISNMDAELNQLRKPGVKHASRKLAGAVKRRIKHSVLKERR